MTARKLPVKKPVAKKPATLKTEFSGLLSVVTEARNKLKSEYEKLDKEIDQMEMSRSNIDDVLINLEDLIRSLENS